MTNEQFSQLLVELHAIKALLSRAQPQPAAPATKPGDKAIPMPDAPVPNAEDVAVHFGKNKGVRLGDLQIRSIEWYAQDAEPKLKNDGTPFPPREDDVRLRQAARTIVHQRRGMLPPSPAKPITLTNTVEDETVPF